MNLINPRDAQAPSSLRTATLPEELVVFHEPDCAAMLWQQPPPEGLTDWLDRLPPDQLPRWRETLAYDAVEEAVLEACAEAGTPEGSERDALIQIIQALANTSAEVFNAEFLNFRLEVINSNACRKFHIDAVESRVVCTLRGTGTQYGYAQNGADPDVIETTPRLCSIFLRGSLWPPIPDPHFVHRSPPIEGTGEHRLVVVFDKHNSSTRP